MPANYRCALERRVAAVPDPILHGSLRDWNGKTKNRGQAESKKRPHRALGALPPPPENNNTSRKTNEQRRQLYREH